MTNIQKQLFEISDKEYAEFSAKLTPNLSADKFIGVRVPKLREFAKSFAKAPECEEFLNTLPHEYYDENLLHSILLENSKNFETCMENVEDFLPYVDNWAVCDTLRPKTFAKHKAEVLDNIKTWIKSEHTYTCRFGIDMLMTHFLDGDFKPEYLEYPASVISSEYYVNMMIAWYFATALAKQWDVTVAYIEQYRLPAWVHNKTIQKACESFRITAEQKTYLKGFKV